MLSREQPMLCEIERIFFLLFVCTTHFLGVLVIILAFFAIILATIISPHNKGSARKKGWKGKMPLFFISKFAAENHMKVDKKSAARKIWPFVLITILTPSSVSGELDHF